jgi:hypothetical protein
MLCPDCHTKKHQTVLFMDPVSVSLVSFWYTEDTNLSQMFNKNSFINFLVKNKRFTLCL